MRDRPFLALLGLNVVFVAAGYETLLLTPVYAKNQAGVSERWIGMIWFANTSSSSSHRCRSRSGWRDGGEWSRSRR